MTILAPNPAGSRAAKRSQQLHPWLGKPGRWRTDAGAPMALVFQRGLGT